MAKLTTREGALRVLGEHRIELLGQCVDGAWEKFEEHIQPLLPVCSPGGIATIIHELVAEEARNRLADQDGIHIIEGERFLATVDGQLTVQFRKLTQNLLTRNNPTETSDLFDNQEPGIDGIPDHPRLTVGYQLGMYGTEISGKYLVFNVGRENVWYHDLESGEYSITLEFPDHQGPSAADLEAAEEEQRRTEAEDKEEAGGAE